MSTVLFAWICFLAHTSVCTGLGSGTFTQYSKAAPQAYYSIQSATRAPTVPVIYSSYIKPAFGAFYGQTVNYCRLYGYSSPQCLGQMYGQARIATVVAAQPVTSAVVATLPQASFSKTSATVQNSPPATFTAKSSEAIVPSAVEQPKAFEGSSTSRAFSSKAFSSHPENVSSSVQERKIALVGPSVLNVAYTGQQDSSEGSNYYQGAQAEGENEEKSDEGSEEENTNQIAVQNVAQNGGQTSYQKTNEVTVQTITPTVVQAAPQTITSTVVHEAPQTITPTVIEAAPQTIAPTVVQAVSQSTPQIVEHVAQPTSKEITQNLIQAAQKLAAQAATQIANQMAAQSSNQFAAKSVAPTEGLTYVSQANQKASESQANYYQDSSAKQDYYSSAKSVQTDVPSNQKLNVVSQSTPYASTETYQVQKEVKAPSSTTYDASSTHATAFTSQNAASQSSFDTQTAAASNGGLIFSKDSQGQSEASIVFPVKITFKAKKVPQGTKVISTDDALKNLVKNMKVGSSEDLTLNSIATQKVSGSSSSSADYTTSAKETQSTTQSSSLTPIIIAPTEKPKITIVRETYIPKVTQIQKFSESYTKNENKNPQLTDSTPSTLVSTFDGKRFGVKIRSKNNQKSKSAVVVNQNSQIISASAKDPRIILGSTLE